jgi:hypothetical protein
MQHSFYMLNRGCLLLVSNNHQCVLVQNVVGLKMGDSVTRTYIESCLWNGALSAKCYVPT